MVSPVARSWHLFILLFQGMGGLYILMMCGMLFGQAGRGRGVVARGRAGGPPARGGARGARTAASVARGGGRAPARGGARAKGSLPGEDGLYLHLLSPL